LRGEIVRELDENLHVGRALRASVHGFPACTFHKLVEWTQQLPHALPELLGFVAMRFPKLADQLEVFVFPFGELVQQRFELDRMPKARPCRRVGKALILVETELFDCIRSRRLVGSGNGKRPAISSALLLAALDEVQVGWQLGAQDVRIEEQIGDRIEIRWNVRIVRIFPINR
jgi:hypothetical protein